MPAGHGSQFVALSLEKVPGKQGLHGVELFT
jgi:hypothetical protein